MGSDWINSVQLGTLNNVSGAVSPATHYIFYNNLAAPNLTKGGSYTLSLNFYVGGGAGYAAWIDFNHDHVFDSTERVAGIVASSGMSLGSSVPVTAMVVIPATALLGNTRMRIRIDEDDTYHSTHMGAYELACDSLNTTSFGGETEDYTVNITPALSVTEIDNNFTLKVSPNPVTNKVSFETGDGSGQCHVTIYNVTGQRILQQNFMYTTTLDIQQFPSGLYLYELLDDSGRSVKGKIVKQ